jgi:signal transduction histidine kinase
MLRRARPRCAQRARSRPAFTRLVVRIYLAVLASLVVFALLAALSFKLFVPHSDDESDTDIERVLIQGLGEDLFPADAAPADWQPALTRWSERLGIDLSVHDRNGEPLVWSGSEPAVLGARARSRADEGDFWRAFDGREPRLSIALPGGRYLQVTDPQRRWIGRWRGGGFVPVLGGLVLIGVAVAIAAWPLTRRLTRRLEGLESSVRAFGAGDLSARSRVRGRDEIGSLAASFNESADRIERLVQAQKSLLANASHELRSPLARIRMAAALLRDRGSDTGALHDELARSVAELDALVDEILLASRLEAEQGGQAEGASPETVDLGGVLAEEAARLGLESDAGPVELRGDARLLRRLVRNLLENALRYGGEQARDGIELSLQHAGEAGALLRVCDRGPGVPPDERDRIFEPFYRARGRSEREGGVGLGLSLVRRIAERHGGTARCLPRDGGGACFEVRLNGMSEDRPGGHG